MACKDTEERMTLVKAAGFEFCGADIASVTQELTNKDLDAICGGSGAPGDPSCHGMMWGHTN